MPLTDHPDNDGCGNCDMPLCPFAGKVAVAHICGVDECTKRCVLSVIFEGFFQMLANHRGHHFPTTTLFALEKNAHC